MSANANSVPAEAIDLQTKLAKAEADLRAAQDACAAAKTHLDNVLNPKTTGIWTRGEQYENVWQPLVSVVLLLTGLASLYWCIHWLAVGTALAINVFLAVLLIAMSVRRSLREHWLIEFAHRFYFILIFFFLLAGLIVSFGRMYIDSGCVYRTADNPPKYALEEPNEAIYFSTVTIMTVGYGDFAPRGNAEMLVVWEMASGAMVLLIILPVLASRLALLGEGH
jgi:hypothetical protein